MVPPCFPTVQGVAEGGTGAALVQPVVLEEEGAWSWLGRLGVASLWGAQVCTGSGRECRGEVSRVGRRVWSKGEGQWESEEGRSVEQVGLCWAGCRWDMAADCSLGSEEVGT